MAKILHSFYVSKQKIRRTDFFEIASGSSRFISFRFDFSPDWDGLSKTVTFTVGGQLFCAELAQDGTIPDAEMPALPAGSCILGLRGVDADGTVATTAYSEPVEIAPGTTADGAAVQPIPASYGELILQKAAEASALAQSVRDDADAGRFKGETGAVGATGAKGDTGAQGMPGQNGAPGAKGDKGDTGAQGEPGQNGAPGAKGDKGDTGAQGEPGHNGADGYTPVKGVDYFDGAPGAAFTPAMTADGLLSWTNNGGLANPAPVSLKGPAGTNGIDGADGTNGTTAYQSAVVGGYTGTEAQFNAALAKVQPTLIESTDTTYTIASLADNTVYYLGTLTALTITAFPASGHYNANISFTAGAALTPSVPTGAKWLGGSAPTTTTGRLYELDIRDGKITVGEFY